MRAARVAAQGLGELLITLGLLLLLFVAWQLWWTDVVSNRSQNQTTRELEQSWKPQAKGTPGVAAAKDPQQPVAEVSLGDAFALIRVPRFGKDYARPILQGIELSVLEDGVGHYPDSVGPGGVGNFSLAGHRVTYGKPFNRIDELRTGDPIVIETKTTWYVYRVVRHKIVTPDRVDVVAPVPEKPGVAPREKMMTMTACHPEFSAAERYIVFSKLSETIPKTGGAVPDILTAAAP